jgi:Ca2+-binding RTX toxin-like protein
MATSSRLPVTPSYLQNPVNFLEGDLGVWSSDALIAWGSDKYIYLKESRISSNDGERIDAYVLDQYGEIINYYENISEGDSGVSVGHIQISGIEGEKLYFSYQTNVWSGFSSPSVSVSSLSLENFTSNQIFSQSISGYVSNGADRPSYSISQLSENQIFIAYNSNTHVRLDNLIEVIDLESGNSNLVLNCDYNITSINYSSGFLTYTFNDSHYSHQGNLQVSIYDTTSEEEVLTSELISKRIWTTDSAVLSDGSIVVTYSTYLGKTIYGKIYNSEGTGLEKEFLFSSSYAFDPKILATSDGGFLLSFIYTDGAVGHGNYYRDQVIVRFDALGNQISENLREVTGEYYEISTLAVDQDGGVIGVSGDEVRIKSAVFLAQLFGTPENDNLLGTDDVNTIFTFAGDDLIQSLGGNDYVDAGGGNNSIYTGSGSDQIWLDAGVNFVDGGEGSDWLLFDDELTINLDLSIETTQDFGSFSAQIANVENIDAGNFNDILLGSASENEIWGRAGNDIIQGNAGDDTLSGGAGDDVIDGGEGNDEIFGGDGDDIIYTSAGNDIYDGGDGVDTVITDYINSPPTLGGSISLRNIENQFFIGDTNITINRSGDPDSGDNHVKSQGGNDRVLLGVGDDKFELGAGINYSNGGSGNDTIILEGNGTFSSDLDAYNISSVLQTGTNERINLTGKTRFEDVIDGGADIDTVELTHESDAFFLHDSFSSFHSSLEFINDFDDGAGTARIENIENINAGDGDDIVDLTSPDYSLVGQGITVDGGSGNDTIWGSDANETLIGGDGDDDLFGGAGINELIGGSGADEFQFTRTSINDTIADFDITEGDTLKFFNTDEVQFDRDSVSLNSTGDELSIAYGTDANDVMTITLTNAGLQLGDLTSDVLYVDSFIL